MWNESQERGFQDLFSTIRLSKTDEGKNKFASYTSHQVNQLVQLLRYSCLD